MRELLFARDLRMTRPALQKAEERSGVILSETGSDHLHVITEEVSRVAELCITQNMGAMGTAKYVPGTRDVCKKKQTNDPLAYQPHSTFGSQSKYRNGPSPVVIYSHSRS